jgi:anti-sigma regulatory factor (Ser/Thr protein kinase)
MAQGLSLVDQTKIVTAASELARNTLDSTCTCPM